MNKEDWLRIQMLKVAPKENKRMRAASNMQPNRDQWSMIKASKTAGALGGRPKHKGSSK